jgi:hypothetical protein
MHQARKSYNSSWRLYMLPVNGESDHLHAVVAIITGVAALTYDF